MQGGHERAWAEALAQEHAHQQELLAAFRGELGAFARECSAALTALDAYCAGIGIAEVLDAARTGHRHAALVLDVSRRLPGLAPATVAVDDELTDLYAGLAEGGDAPPRLVSHAGEVLRAAPKRTDRELLRAVVDAGGVRSRIEQLIGPAPVAALTALAPLARRLPGLATIDGGEAGPAGKDLLRALEATAELTAAEGLAAVSDAASLAASVHTAVEHVQGAARAVEEGRLEQVLAQARLQLERDLGELRAVLAAAGDAPPEWLTARRAELEALTEEVREKRERIERTRRALAALLPHLQAVSRALATVEKLQALEGRLDPRLGAGAEAARLTLLLDLSGLLGAIVPGGPQHGPRPRSRGHGRTRWLVAAALAVVAAAGIAIAVATSGGSEEPAAVSTSPPPPPATTTQASVPTPAPPPAPEVSAVEAVFDEGQRATFYSVAVSARRQGEPTYAWHLTPPADDPGCNRFAPVPGSPGRAVWHHADTDGCSHAGSEHAGTVTVTITTSAWKCTATFEGTETRTGPPPQRCRQLPS